MNSSLALNEFNSALRSAGDVAVEAAVPPMIFICGAPRSGTTLAYQALFHGGNLGCVNNIVARFIENPVLGVRLSQALGLTSVFTGRSDFGRTETLIEPHEFGQGWARMLGTEGLAQPSNDIELPKQAVKDLSRFAAAWEKPVVFKSFSYLWFIKDLAESLPQSLWLHIRRSTKDNSTSLQRLYHTRGKAELPDHWESAVCRSTIARATGLPISERCDMQIEDINAYISNCFDAISPSRCLKVDYERYATNPRRTTESILNFFGLDPVPEHLTDLPS